MLLLTYKDTYFIGIIQKSMNILDIILLVCLVPAAIEGFRKGLVSQVVSLLSLFLGAWLSFRLAGLVSDWITPYLADASPAMVQVIAFILVMVVVAALLYLVGKGIKALLKVVLLGGVDKLLGAVLGLLKTGLVIGLIIILFNTVNTKLELVKPEVLDGSVLYGPCKDIAYAVFPYFKELLVK